MGLNVSLTVFIALCVLGADFLVYFFFKLTFSEKYRSHPRRLPPHYYSTKEQTPALYRLSERKSGSSFTGRVVPLPQPSHKNDPGATTAGGGFTEPIPFRRVS